MANTLKVVAEQPRKESPLSTFRRNDTDIYEELEPEVTYAKISQNSEKPAAVHSSKPRSKLLKKIVLSIVILALCTLCCVLLAIHLLQARSSNSCTCTANERQGNNNSTSTDLPKQKLSNLTCDTKRKDKECPTGWKLLGGRCYYFSDERLSDWHVAKNECLARGGHLAVPRDSDENNLIYSEITKLKFHRVWIGVYRNDGKLYSVQGNEVSYTNWMSGEPSFTYKNGAEDCIEMIYDSKENVFGQWNDRYCKLDTPQFILYYICQKTDQQSM